MVASPKKGTDAGFEKLAAKWKAVEEAEPPILYRKVPYKGFVGAVLTDGGVLGVSGFADRSAMVEALQELAG